MSDEPHHVMVRGRKVYFTFNWRFGPLLTDVEGEPLDRQPMTDEDRFWAPFQVWLSTYKQKHPNPFRLGGMPLADPSDYLDKRPSVVKLKGQDNG